MTKVKLHLKRLGPIYLEGDNPESLAKFILELEKSPEFQLIEETNLDTNITMLETKICKQENKDISLPPVNKFKEYILSKANFAHDSVELMYKLVGRKIKSKEEPLLFSSFNNKLKKAREQIEKEYNIKWDTNERKSYDRYTHPIVYKKIGSETVKSF